MKDRISYPSAKVGSCERTCLNFNSMKLHFFNFVDFVLGVGLCVFGFYLYEKVGSDAFMNPEIAWLCWLVCLLGVLLFFTSMLSFCSITNSGCRWGVMFSSHIGLIVAILSLTVASTCLGMKGQVTDYLNSNGPTLGLGDSEINFIMTWYSIIAYVLFGLCIFELLRYRTSKSFRETVLRVDGEFDALLAEEDKQWSTRMTANQSAREEKYADLRSHYKQKYSSRNSDV